MNQEKKSYIEFTQENSIENLVQDYLPYILKAHSLCPTTLAYPKWPCVFLKVNMYYICYMMSFFHNLLCSSIVTCDYVTVTDVWQHDSNIMHNPNPKFQNEKGKENENK